MTAKAKVWLLVSIALILMGCVLFSCVMMSIRWDFRKLSTTKYETNTYAITESFSDVHIIIISPARRECKKIHFLGVGTLRIL